MWASMMQSTLVNCRSGAGQRKFAGQRPTFYHWATSLSSDDNNQRVLPCTHLARREQREVSFSSPSRRLCRGTDVACETRDQRVNMEWCQVFRHIATPAQVNKVHTGEHGMMSSLPPHCHTWQGTHRWTWYTQVKSSATLPHLHRYTQVNKVHTGEHGMMSSLPPHCRTWQGTHRWTWNDVKSSATLPHLHMLSRAYHYTA